MDDYNDGSKFGYDDISPYEDYPINFSMAIDDDNSSVLVAKNEYPLRSVIKPIDQTDQLSEVSLVKTLKNPYTAILTGAKYNPNDAESFTSTRHGHHHKKTLSLTNDDIQLIMFFMLIISVVVQIKSYMAIDLMTKMSIYGKNNVSIPPNQLSLV